MSNFSNYWKSKPTLLEISIFRYVLGRQVHRFLASRVILRELGFVFTVNYSHD